MPAETVFSANDLRDYQPELAARLEEEIREAVAEGSEVGTLQCRITEKRAERAMVVVLIEGDQWSVTFAVSAPPVAGEIKSETRRALRDRGRRTPSYRRSTRR